MSLLDVLDNFQSGSSNLTQKKLPPMPGFARPVKQLPSGSGYADDGGSGAARSSRERGAPERIDINSFVPQGFGNSQPPAESLPLQALEVAGRAPGFVAERPIALASKIFADDSGHSFLDDVGNFGPIKFLGEVVGNVSGLPAAIANSSTADSLRKGTEAGWSDDQLLKVGVNRQMTWGEFKAEAARKGWTAQDIQDLIAGRKATTDFGSKAMSDDPLTEMALRVGSDPMNLAFGVGAAAKLGSGAGMLARATKAGAMLEKPLEPSLAAIASAQGISRGSTWMGLARYFGQVGRGLGTVPGAVRGLELGARGVELGAQGLSAYKKAAIGITAGQVGLGVVDRATAGIRGGFLEGLFELNREVWDNQPLSQNSAFMLFSAFHFNPVSGIGRVVNTAKGVKAKVLPHNVREDVVKALQEGEGWQGQASREAVINSLGGQENLDNLIVHTHAQIVMRDLMRNPIIKATLTHFDSLDEAIIANHKLGTMIEGILEDAYKKDRFTGKETVAQLKDWFANRSNQKQNGVEFQWDGRHAVDRWVEYSSAVAPVSQIFQERGDVVMGLVDHVMAEDLMNMGSAFRIAGGAEKQVPIVTVREWLSRYPQMLEDPYWSKFNTHEFDGTTVPYGKLQGKLTRLVKEAPTSRDVTREMAEAEHGAAKQAFLDEDAPAEIERASASIGVSRMRPQIARRLGLKADRVDDVVASRSDPDVATFEGRVGEVLSDIGLDVDRVEQSVGAWEGSHEPSVRIAMSGTLHDLRVAAALAGKAGKQDAVVVHVPATRARELGLKPNGYEAKILLPNTTAAQLQSISDLLSREFPGYTINDTTGVISILAQGGKEDELAAALSRLGPELEQLFDKDLIGDTGVSTSIHPSFVQFITKKKGGGDASYAEVLSEARAYGDPRADLSEHVSSALAHRRAAPRDAAAGLGPDEAVGRDAGGAGRLSHRDATQSPATRVGPGRVEDLPAAEPGFVYHVTTDDALDVIANEGLKAQYPEGAAWPDGGTGKRLPLTDDPVADGVPGVVVRVRREDAGRIRRGLVDQGLYSAKAVKPALVEVWGADGQWHPANKWFEPSLEPDIVEGAQTTLPEYQAHTEGTFDPVPDPLTAGLRAHEDEPFRAGPATDEAPLLEQLAGGDAAAADRLEAARFAKGEARRGQVVWAARRDAEVSSEIPLHRSLSGLDDVSKAELGEFEKRLRESYPAYTLKKSPEPAIIMADRGEIATRYLRDRSALADAVASWGPLGKISRTLDWLTTPVRNEALGKAARQSLMHELIPHGAKPKEVDEFLSRLERQAELNTIGPFQVRAFRNGTSLTQQAINKIAAGDPEAGITPIFSAKTIEAIGRDNFARVLDRASNRFIRTVDATARAGGRKGQLARAVGTMYGKFQHTAAGDANRLVSKTLYHWFRFISDPRWWAMNMLEADLIGGVKYGLGVTRFTGAHKAEVGKAALVHQFGPGGAESGAFERALGDGNGWLYTRRQGGYISRAFDHERPETVLKILREMPENDPVIADLKSIVQAEDLKSGRTARTEGEILDEDMVEAIDRMLYSFDQKGARATFVDEAKDILGEQETQNLLPFLQKVWEANDKTYHSIVEMFHGNPARTNLERIANSYWLYWPISYQIKATKWLVSAMADGAFGQKTNLAGAALYAHHVEQHRERLANDPAYVQMFEDHPTLWFMAQMLFPITPGDIGVSLSRPVRYAGGAAGDALEGATGSRLGLWGAYKSADDPVTAAGAIMSLGPVYTAELLARAGRELFKEPTQNLYP